MAEKSPPHDTAAPSLAPSADGSFRFSVERRKGSLALVTVEIDAARVSAATDRVFKRRVSEARIPGFRPGKAPRPIYERHHGSEHLWHEAAEDVIEETYREIVQSEQLSPIDRPNVSADHVEADKPLRYTATVVVRPEVRLGDYGAHGATVEPAVTTEEDVERTIAAMREHHAELRPVERAGQAADVLTVDVDADLEGRQLPPMGRNAHIELGRQYAIPGLAEGLLGARAGDERALDLAFPEDHPDEGLRGKRANFRVRVSQVSEKVLPALDDDFARTVGVADLAALHKAVRDEMAHAAFHEARDAAADKALTHAVAGSEVEVPEILIQDELDHMVADLTERVRQQGLTWEQFLLQARKTAAAIREDWRPVAERRAKSLLVLDEIARREDVKVSSAELAQEVALAPIGEQDAKALRSPAVLAAMARQMRNRKVIDKLIGLEGPDAERELIEKAGGSPDAIPHAVPQEATEAPEVAAAAKPEATSEGREAIRALMEKGEGESE